jgi:quinol monooxygenase YgiN
VLVMTRFDVPVTDGEDFLVLARAALGAFAARPGYVRGRVGRAVDSPTEWVLSTEWESVAAYRRSLSGFDVKVHGVTLLARGRDEVSAFEVLADDDGAIASLRAVDADTTGPPKAPR